MNETQLIEQASLGDGSAIQALYSAYAPRVYAVVRRIAGNDAQAEDWAQEAWVRAIRALPAFRGEARFSTWIHRIAVNSALHGRRSGRRREEREGMLRLERSDATGSPRTLLRLRLERALERLPDGMRQVMVLHDVEGYTHEEIGEMLGVAPGTSKSQLFKARARMRALLGSQRAREEEEACHT